MTKDEREVYTDRIEELEEEVRDLESDKGYLDDELDEKIEEIKNLKAGVDVSRISANQFCDVLDAVMDRMEKGEVLRFCTHSRLARNFSYDPNSFDQQVAREVLSAQKFG